MNSIVYAVKDFICQDTIYRLSDAVKKNEINFNQKLIAASIEISALSLGSNRKNILVTECPRKNDSLQFGEKI